MKPINSVRGLFMQELKSMYYVEKMHLKELESMSKGATDNDLVEVIQGHREHTADQVDRLEEIFSIMGESPGRHESHSFKGVLDEIEHLNNSIEDDDLSNLVFMSKAIKIERLEISMYENLIMLSKELKMDDVQDHLEKSLEEEKDSLRDLKALKTDSSFKKLIHDLMS